MSGGQILVWIVIDGIAGFWVPSIVGSWLFGL